MKEILKQRFTPQELMRLGEFYQEEKLWHEAMLCFRNAGDLIKLKELANKVWHAGIASVQQQVDAHPCEVRCMFRRLEADCKFAAEDWGGCFDAAYDMYCRGGTPSAVQYFAALVGKQDRADELLDTSIRGLRKLLADLDTETTNS